MPALAVEGCPNCGAALEAGAVFCTGCGFNLKTRSVVQTAMEAEGEPVEPDAYDAVAVARALAHAIGGLRLVAVPSLDVIAENAPAEFATVLPVLDAKRGQIFTALYGRDAGRSEERR